MLVLKNTSSLSKFKFSFVRKQVVESVLTFHDFLELFSNTRFFEFLHFTNFRAMPNTV